MVGIIFFSDCPAEIMMSGLISVSYTHLFDEHYRQLALQRGRKDLDGSGKLVIYPGSACETYKLSLIHIYFVYSSLFFFYLT